MNKIFYILLISLSFSIAPEWQEFDFSSIPEDGIDFDEDLSAYVTDPDDIDAEITITWICDDQNAQCSETGNLIVNPNDDYFGTIEIQLTATDEDDESQSTTLEIVVTPVNDPPSFSGNDIEVDEGESYNESWAVNVSAGPSNESEQDLSFDIEFAEEDLILFHNITDAGQIMIEPLNDDIFGETTFQVTISDGEEVNQFFSESFIYRINPINDAPRITNQEEIVESEDCGLESESCDISNMLELDISMFTVSDVEDDEAGLGLELFIDETDDTFEQNYTTDGGLGILFNEDYFGPITVPVYVKDSVEEESERFYCEITVTPVNDPPYYEIVDGDNGNIEVDEDDVYNQIWAVNVSAGAYNEFEDLEFDWNFLDEDGNLVGYSDLSIEGTDGIFQISPFQHQFGEVDFTVQLNETGDDGLSSPESTYTYSVESVNDQPIILDQLEISMIEDCNNQETGCTDSNKLTLSIDDIIVQDIEDDLAELSLELFIDYDNIGSGYTTDDGLGIILDSNHDQNITVPIYISDSEGFESDIFTLQITVTPINDLPVIISQSEISEYEDCGSATDTEQEDNQECNPINKIMLDISMFGINDVEDTDLELFIDSGNIGDDYTVVGDLGIYLNPNYFGAITVPVYIVDTEGGQSTPYNCFITVNAINDIPRWNISLFDAVNKIEYEDCEDQANIDYCSTIGEEGQSICDNDPLCDWIDASCTYVQDVNDYCSGDGEGEQYILENITQLVSDVETDSSELSYNINSSGDNYTDSNGNYIEISNQNLLITPAPQFHGDINFVMQVLDGENSQDTYEFTLSVIALNDGVVNDNEMSFDVPDLIEDFAPLTLNLPDYFSDQEDNNSLIYSLNETLSDPYNGIVGIEIDGQQLTITHIDNQYTHENTDNEGAFIDDDCDDIYSSDSIEIYVTATDLLNRSEIDDDFTISITARNDQPYWNQSTLSGNIIEDCGKTHNTGCGEDWANDWYSIDLANEIQTDDYDAACRSGYTYIIQNSDEIIEYEELIEDEHQYKIVDGMLYVKPKFNFNSDTDGDLIVRVKADDNNNEPETNLSLSEELEITINIESVNDGPYFSDDIDDISVDEFGNEGDIFIDVVDLFDIAYDVEESNVQNLKYFTEIDDISEGYVNYEFNDDTGILEITPIDNYNGVIEFTVSIDDEENDTDNSLSSNAYDAVKVFYLTVNQINDISVATITHPSDMDWINTEYDSKIIVIGLDEGQTNRTIYLSAEDSYDIDEEQPDPGLNLDFDVLSYDWNFLNHNAINGPGFVGNNTDEQIGLILEEGVYQLELTVDDGNEQQVTDEVEIRVGRNEIVLDDNYTFVNSDSIKEVSLTIKDADNSSVLTSGNQINIHLPQSAIDDNLKFTPFSFYEPTIEIYSDGVINNQYNLSYLGDVDNNDVLSWDIENGSNAFYNDFLPNDTEIRINGIRLLSDSDFSVSEFQFYLTIDNSYYTSMDTQVNDYEYDYRDEYNTEKDISIGTPEVYLSDYVDQFSNNFSDWAFVKSDQYSTFNLTIQEDISAAVIQNEFSIKIPDTVTQNIKFSDTQSTSIPNNTGYDILPTVINDGRVLRFNCNNGSDLCSFDDGGGLLIELNDIELDFSSLEQNEVVPAFQFEFYVNEIVNGDNVYDEITDNTVRVGQPSISFDESYEHEIFVLNDGGGHLSEFTYQESSVPTAQGFIEIYIPDGSGFEFLSNNEVPQYLGLSGDAGWKVSQITNYGNGLRLDLSEPLIGNESIVIGPNDNGGNGLYIQLNEETSPTLLKATVNYRGDADCEMDSDDHIRIGNPKVSIDSQVFILSDSINPGCNELALNTITISEGSIPVMRARESITLTLPEHLIWDDTFTDDLFIVGVDELTGQREVLPEDPHSLKIYLDGYLDASNAITIDGAHVIPESITPDNNTANYNARFGLSVNDKDSDNFDNNYDGLDQSDDYIAVDDFYVYWWVYEDGASQTNNDGDISYTLNDESIANEIHFRATNDASYPWPLFSNSDRIIKIIIPEKMNFGSNTSFGGTTELDVEGNILTLNITSSSRDFVVFAYYDFLDIQEPKPIKFMSNSKSILIDYDGEPNVSTPKTYRIGDPTIEFDNDYIHDIFVQHDGSSFLSDIIYKENDYVAAASDWIIINKIDGIDSFDIGDIDYVADDGLINSEEIMGGSGHLKINLTRKLEPGEIVEIKNLGINFSQEFQSFPSVAINVWGDDDAEMVDDNFVRVGQPSIDLTESQVFILSDADNPGCNELELNRITIQESDNSVIRAREGITVRLPEHLQWDASRIDGDNDSDGYLDIDGPVGKLTGFHEVLDDGTNRSLFIGVSNQFEGSDVVTIDNAFVIPQSITQTNDAAARLDLSVNDKSADYDTDLNDQPNYLAVDDFKVIINKEIDPLLADIGVSSNTNNVSFVDTDVNPSMGTITIRRYQNDESYDYLWPIFKDRSLKLRLPNNVFFDENNINVVYTDVGAADNIQVDDSVLSFEFNNLTTDARWGDVEITGNYIIQGEGLAKDIELSTNSVSILNDEADVVTDETIRVGSPSILFTQPEDHDIFVLKDQTGTLSSVTYQESGTAGTADDYIRIRTPDSISFTASNEIENYLQYSGNAATKVLDVRRAQDISNDLVITLVDPLVAGDVITIDNIEIGFIQEVSDTYLMVDVNQFSNSTSDAFDSQMADNNHIRIGDPSIDVLSDQIFVVSESNYPSDGLIMSDIVIEEKTVPVINPDDGIVIHMPYNIEIESLSTEITYFNENDSGVINVNQPSISLDRQSLVFPVTSEFEDGEILRIEGLRVRVKDDTSISSQIEITDTKTAYVSVEVNDKGDNQYNDYYASNFTAVDDINLDFLTQTDQVYVLSDMTQAGYMMMDDIWIDAVRAKFTDIEGNDLYTLDNRPLRLKMPENTRFLSANNTHTNNPCEEAALFGAVSECSFNETDNILYLTFSSVPAVGDIILGQSNDLGIIALDLVPRTAIELTTYKEDGSFDDNLTPNVLSDHTIRVGQPTIIFDNNGLESEVFTLSDSFGELTNIVYMESDYAGSSTDTYGIEIKIPDENHISFNPDINFNVNAYSSDVYDYNANIYDENYINGHEQGVLLSVINSFEIDETSSGKELFIDLARPLIKGESIVVSDLSIVFDGSEDKDIKLKTYINDEMPYENGYHFYDAAMGVETDLIRVGAPSIELSLNKVFILSDPLSSETSNLPRITITEGDVPVIRKNDNDGLNIILPPELLWRDDNLEDIKNSISVIDGLNPDSNHYLDIDGASYTDSNSTLNIPVNNDFDQAGQYIQIDNIKIDPEIITTQLSNQYASPRLSVNDKIQGWEDYTPQNLMVNDVNIEFTSTNNFEGNNNGSHSFVLSDSSAYLADIKVSATNNISNIFADFRHFKFNLPSNLEFTSDYQIDCDGESIDGVIIGEQINDNTLSFYANLSCQGSLNIISPRVLFKDIQDAQEIEIYTTDEGNSAYNKLTLNTIAVGQPTIEFDNDDMGEVFVVNDGYGLLSTIKYKEHEDAASAVDYIKFIIPNDKDFVFSSELADIEGISVSIGGDDDIIPVVEGNGKVLTVNIPPEYQLSENDEVELGQVKILFSSEVSKTALDLRVNDIDNSDTITNSLSYDAIMNDADQIRIGNPSLNIEDDIVFIKSDEDHLGVFELRMPDIAITEGSIPVIRSTEGVTIVLPPSLKWDVVNTENEIQITGPDNLLINDYQFLQNNSELYIPVVPGTEFDEGGLEVLIRNTYVDPQEVTCLEQNASIATSESRLGLKVNDNDSDNIDYYQFDNNLFNTNFAVVDDVTIEFDSDFAGSSDVAYVQSDISVQMNPIHIKTSTGVDNDCYSLPSLDNRPFKVELPDNIYFTDDNISITTGFNTIDVSDITDNILLFNTIEGNQSISTYITIEGHFLLDQEPGNLQDNDWIDLSVNTNQGFNTKTENKLRTGNPEIYFTTNSSTDTGRQMFVRQSNSAVLGQIVYEEAEVPSGIDYVDLHINDSEITTASMIFSDCNGLCEPSIELSGEGEGSICNPGEYSILNNGFTFRINLCHELSGNQIITVDNLNVDFTNQLADHFLELTVNDDDLETSYDYKMDQYQNESYIRVGDPQIDSTGDHVFIAPQLSSTEAIVEEITISSGSIASTINKDDNIIIRIPDNIDLEWNSSLNDWPNFSGYIEGNAASKISSIERLEDGKKLKIFIDQDFDINEEFTIKGATDADSGSLFVDITGTDDGTNNRLWLESCDYNEADEDNKLLAIASPTLSIDDSNIVMLVNRSDVTGNEFYVNMDKVTFEEDGSYPTLKAGQFINIYLANDDKFSCNDPYFRWADLSANPPSIHSKIGNITILNNNETGQEDKILNLEVLQDFISGESFDLDGISVYAPTCQLDDVNDGLFEYTIRNATQEVENPIVLQSEGTGRYKVSNPTMYSNNSQIYFLENDASNVVTLKSLILQEDQTAGDSQLQVLDNDYNPSTDTDINTVMVTLPPEAKWNINDDYIEQNGPDQGDLNSVVTFSGDESVAYISIVGDIENYVEISGLTIIMNATSSSQSNPGILEESITFSFNNDTNPQYTENMIDSSDFYIGDVSFYSDDRNIILKGDNTGNNVHNLNSITIKNNESISNFADYIKGYKISLPPELEISFVEELQTLIEDCLVPGELYYNECSANGLTSAVIDADNIELNDNNKSFEFPIVNIGNTNSFTFPSEILQYNNNSSFESGSMESNLILEPIVSEQLNGPEFYSDCFIRDDEFSYLDAVNFYSDNHNRILLGVTDSLTIGNVSIYDLNIRNGQNPILQEDNIISISLANTNCYWPESSFANADYDPNQIYPLFEDLLDPNNGFKELPFRITATNIPDDSNGLNPIQISNLEVYCEGISDDTNTRIKLRDYSAVQAGLSDSFFGLDIKNTITDVVTIDIPDNSAVWLDGTATFLYDTVILSNSNLLIDNDLSFDLYFDDGITFDLNLIDLLDVSGFSYESLNIFDEGKRLGFMGVSNLDDDNLFINNLPLNIDESIYGYNFNQQHSKNIKLSIPSNFDNNFILSEKSFEFLPSLFFTEPSLFHELSTAKNFMEFFVFDFEGDPGLDIGDPLYFKITSIEDTVAVPLIKSDTNFDNSVPFDNPDLAYSSFNQGLDLWRFNMEDELLNSINVIIDSLFKKNDDINISIFQNYSPSNSRSNSSGNNDSELVFYPGIDPASEYLFLDENRAINPSDDSIVMKAASGAQYFPSIEIASISNQNTTYEINSFESPDMSYSAQDSMITINVPLFSDNFIDGIYNLSMYIKDSESEENKSSIPLSRYYYFDRIAPDVFDIEPWDGMSINNQGHDLTIFDDIAITLIDSSIYFNNENNSVVHILDGSVDSLNLNHIFKNENYIDIEFYFDNIKIEGKEILDTLLYEENYLSLFDISVRDILSDSEIETGEFKILLNSKDQAGNLRSHEISYTLQNSMDEIVSNFFNFPNPFSPLTNEKTYFRYSIVEQNTAGNLLIYDLSGNLIYLRELTSEELTLGTHEIDWDGRTNANKILADGVYFAVIDFNNYKTRVHKVAITNEK